jgi:predicted metal-dependent hydrolase
MAPLSVIDYIVVHELGHIKEKNHSPRFWKIVETTLPDYRTRRDWLKKYGHLLNV